MGLDRNDTVAIDCFTLLYSFDTSNDSSSYIEISCLIFCIAPLQSVLLFIIVVTVRPRNYRAKSPLSVASKILC